jgi:hypothetical protein
MSLFEKAQPTKKAAFKRPRSAPDETAVACRGTIVKKTLSELRTAMIAHAEHVYASCVRLKEAFAGSMDEKDQCAVLECIEIPPSTLVQYDVHEVLEACGLPDVDSTHEEEEDEAEDDDGEYEPVDKKTFEARMGDVINILSDVKESVKVCVSQAANQNGMYSLSLPTPMRNAGVNCKSECPSYTEAGEEELQLLAEMQTQAAEDPVSLGSAIAEPPLVLPETLSMNAPESDVAVNPQSSDVCVTPQEQIVPSGL